MLTTKQRDRSTSPTATSQCLNWDNPRSVCSPPCRQHIPQAVSLQIDQLQLIERHWVIVDLAGKGGRLRTVLCRRGVTAWSMSGSDIQG